MKVPMTDQACPRCLRLARAGRVRIETVQRMPQGAFAPRAMVIKYRAQLAVLAFEKRQRAEQERQARLDRMSDSSTFRPEDLEAEMMRIEAEGDLEQTRREERAKAAWQASVER